MCPVCPPITSATSTTWPLTTSLTCTADEPVSIAASAYPHIIDAILSHSSSWLALRFTCREFRDRVDALLYAHLVVTESRAGTVPDEIVLLVSRPDGRLLPPLGHMDAHVPSDGDFSSALAHPLAQQRQERQKRWQTVMERYTRVVDVFDFTHPGWVPDHLSNVHTLRTHVPPYAWAPIPSESFQARVPASTAVLFPSRPWQSEHGTEGTSFVSDHTRKIVSHVPYHPDRGPAFAISVRPLDGVDWSLQLGITDLVLVFHDQTPGTATYKIDWAVPASPTITGGGFTGTYPTSPRGRWMSLVWNIIRSVEGRTHIPPRVTVVDYPTEVDVFGFRTPEQFCQTMIEINEDDDDDPIAGLADFARGISFVSRAEYQRGLEEEVYKLEMDPAFVYRAPGVLD